ncbi:DUF5320 domain-containing protein [bacterium]|nr:DUF5320 domain-containing protein [bacterium]
MNNCCNVNGNHHGHKHHEDQHQGCGCGCGCSCCGPSFRKFITKEEQLEKLESYEKQLKLELQAVNEKIQDLK